MASPIDISAIARVIDQASAPLRAIMGSVNQTGKAAQGATNSFVRMQKSFHFGGLTAGVRGFSTSLGGLARQVGNMVKPMLALAGIAGFGGAIAGMKEFITTADNLAKRARQLGTTAETLQKFRFAAQQSGVETGSLETSLGRLMKALGTAAQGGKAGDKLIPLFRKMGISMQEIRAGNLEVILPKIAEGFRVNTNAVTRTQMALTLFGKSGGQLINMLAGGSEAMRELMAEAVQLGIITNADAAEAENAKNAWGEFERAITGVKNAIAVQFLPAVAPMLRNLRDIIIANREIIATEVGNFFRRVGQIIEAIDWQRVWRGIRAVGNAIDWTAQKLGGWEHLLLAIAAYMSRGFLISLAKVAIGFVQLGVGIVSAIPQIATALSQLPAALAVLGKSVAVFTAGVIKAFAAMTVAFFSTPVGWVVAAIAAIIAAGVLLWKYWEPISQFFADLWDGIKATFLAVLGWLDQFVGLFIPGGLTAIWEGLAAVFGPIWEAVRGAFWGALGWLDQFVGLFIPGGFATAWEALAGVFSALWDGVHKTFTAVLDWLGNFLGQFVPQPIKDAWASLPGFFEDLWKGVVSWFEWAWAKISAIGEWIGGAVGKVTGAVQGVIGKVGGWFGGGQAPAIPAAAAQAATAAAPVVQMAAAASPTIPAAAAGQPPAPRPNLVRQAKEVQPVRLEGEVQQRLKVDLTPGLRAQLAENRSKGPVRAEVDVGRSMEPALAG